MPRKPSVSHRVPHITVGHFYANHAETLGLRLEGASRGLNRKIREPTINRPGLAISGFYNYFAGKRIQVLGSAELSYLRSLSAATLQERQSHVGAWPRPIERNDADMRRDTAPDRHSRSADRATFRFRNRQAPYYPASRDRPLSRSVGSG